MKLFWAGTKSLAEYPMELGKVSAPQGEGLNVNKINSSAVSYSLGTECEELQKHCGPWHSDR